MKIIYTVLIGLLITTNSYAETPISGSGWQQDTVGNQDILRVADDIEVIDVDVPFDGISSTGPFAHDGQVYFNLTSDENISINCTDHTMQNTDGCVRIEQRPEIENTSGLRVDTNAEGQDKTNSVNINITADGIKAGEAINGIIINGIAGTADGGTLYGATCVKVGNAGLDMPCLFVTPGADAILQVSGGITPPDTAFKFDDSLSIFTNITAALASSTNNIRLFEENNDQVCFLNDNKFSQIAFTLTTNASGAGIKPTLEYTDGVGGFLPVIEGIDTTKGLKNDGAFVWIAANQAGWETDTINGVSGKFGMCITRTQSNLNIVPTERIVDIVEGVNFSWDKNGDVNINNLTFTGSGGVPYGEICTTDNVTETSISDTGEGNKVQVVIFDTNGESNNTTPDHTNDHITIDIAGAYLVTSSITAESISGAAVNIGFNIFKNDGATKFENLHAHRDLTGGGGDVGSISLSGIVTLAVNDTIELWIWNELNTQNIIIEDATISINQVGG